MRLTCPYCDAQYEVPSEVIPQAGRDVQCSDCGQTWYQYHPDNLPEEDQPTQAPAARKEKTPPAMKHPGQVQPKRRELDKGVASILNEEAAIEEAARAGLRRTETPENKPDLGIDVADFVQKNSVPKQNQPPKKPKEPPALPGAAVAAGAAAGRREVFPDVEEINSSLRSAAGNQTSAEGDAPVDGPTHKRKRNGFRFGFWIVLLLFVIGLLVYVFTPQIIEQFPEAREYLDQYVEAVDKARVWIDAKVQDAMQLLNSYIGDSATAIDEIDAPLTDTAPAESE